MFPGRHGQSNLSWTWLGRVITLPERREMRTEPRMKQFVYIIDRDDIVVVSTTQKNKRLGQGF